MSSRSETQHSSVEMHGRGSRLEVPVGFLVVSGMLLVITGMFLGRFVFSFGTGEFVWRLLVHGAAWIVAVVALLIGRGRPKSV